jgi:hypothetical protein
MIRTIRLGTVIAAFSLTLFAGLTTSPAADEKLPEWKPFLPAADLKILVEQASQRMKPYLNDLADGKVDEDDLSRTLKRVRGLALLIASYNQSALPDDDLPHHAAQRDLAMHIDRALRDGKYAEARKGWTELAAVRGKGPTTALRAVHDAKDREDAVVMVMRQVGVRWRLGLGVDPQPRDRNLDGMEAALRVLSTRPDGLAMKPEELARFGYQAAVLAQFTASLAPEKKIKDKDPLVWLESSKTMLDGALELAKAAREQKPDAVRAAARKVNAGCNDCHRVFRRI